MTVVTRRGQRFTLPISRLSSEDAEFVKNRVESATAAEPSKAEDRFTDIEGLSADEIPANGTAHAGFESVDEAIREFMVEKGIGAVTLAISRGGQVLHDRAFGWGDSDLTIPLQPGVKMRIASMTKPLVKAAVLTLARDGKLGLDDLVFDYLELGGHPEARGADPRWQTVTLQHLLDHKGGWDRDLSGDFTNSSSEMTEMFRVPLERLAAEHVVRFGMTRNFDFDPGERYAYSNYGYILLVRVIEKSSGQPFVEFLQNSVCAEAQAPSFSLSSSDARDRQAGEIWYCYHPDYATPTVPLRFRTEARDGAGALACTAADYCRFLEAYWISGEPRSPGQRYRYSFSGSHPGVSAISDQRSGGFSYAVICNRRGKPADDWNGALRERINAELEKIPDQP